MVEFIWTIRHNNRWQWIKDLIKMVFYLVGEFETEQRRKINGGFLGKHLPCITMIYVVAR